MDSSSPIVLGFLKSSRRRLLRLEAISGLALATTAVMTTVISAILIQLVAGELGWWRVVLLSSLMTSLILLGYLYGLRPRLRWSSLISVAREMETRLDREGMPGKLEPLELVSAVELDQKLPDLVQNPSVSPDLVKAHLEQVANLLSKCNISGLVSSSRLRKPFFLAAATIGMAALAGIGFSDPATNGLNELLFSKLQAVKPNAMDGASWVGDIALTYNYPAYSGREVIKVENTDGNIVALPGTRVFMVSYTDREVERASLVLGGMVLPLAIEKQRKLSGELMVMKNGNYRFELMDIRGRVWTEVRSHTIQVEKDAAPSVKLMKPGGDLVVREQEAVELFYEARDDIGLREIRLVWHIPERIPEKRHKVLRSFSSLSTRLDRHAWRWDLTPLNLQPSDVVQFYIEAYDHDAVLGPKLGRSAGRSLKIFSAEEHHRDLLEQAQALWESLLLLLANGLDLRLSDQGMENALAAKKSFRRVLETSDGFAKQSKQLIAELQEDRLARASLIHALLNNHRSISELQRQLQNLLSQPGIAVGLTNRLSQHNERRIDLLERDVLYFEDLLDLIRLEDLDRIARELAAASERLGELVQQYAKAPNNEVRGQIESAIALLKEKIAKLLARQHETIKVMRDEYLNPEELARMLSKTDMMAGADQIQRLLMEGRINEAIEAVARLRQQVGTFQSAVLQSRMQYGSEKYTRLMGQIQQVRAELEGVIQSQKNLAGSTDELQQRLLKSILKLNRARLKRALARIRKRLGGVIDKISEIPPGDLEPYRGHFVTEPLQQAKLLDQALGAMDLMGAKEMAQKLDTTTSRLERVLESMAAFEGMYGTDSSTNFAHYHRISMKAHREAGDILRQIEALLPKPNQLLDRGELALLEQLAKQQDRLRHRLQQLQSKVEQINKLAPLFGAEPAGRLGRCDGRMGQASRQLGLHQPQNAYPHQKAALWELEGLRDTLEKSYRPGTGGMPMPLSLAAGMHAMGWGGDADQREVEIPGPDEYKPPEAFRKALLEGMRDPVPEEFEQPVKKYYQELVK